MWAPSAVFAYLVSGPTAPVSRHWSGRARAGGYDGPEMAAGELSDRAAGYSFTPPEGWRAEEEGGRFGLAGPSGDTLAIVLPHAAPTPEELRPLFEEGWVEPGLELKPTGEASVGEEPVTQRLAGEVQGQPAEGMLTALFSPHGGGVIVIGISVGGGPDIEPAVRDIAGSVRFAVPDTAEVIESWDSALRGKKLTYLHSYGSSGPAVEGMMTGGGMTEQHDIVLSPDGSFEEHRESSLTIDVGGAGTWGGERAASDGTWEIVVVAGQAHLELRKPDLTETYLLSESEGEIRLDGRRYFVT